MCDRQHKVRDAIVAAVSAADTCADVTAAHRAGIASLDLSGEAIDSLRKADFEGLTGLTELNLSGNALDYLPGNLFEHVATLTGLKLNANAALAALPASLFAGLTALEELELRANALTVLPRGVFDGLTALQGLDLRRNGLTALPAAVFGDLTELRRLKLAQNALASLPDGVFETLAKLEDGGLSLGDNPGSADFVPQIAVGAPAQTLRSGVRVDLEATAEPNPWGSNLLWSWTRTDTGGETVTLEDDDTRTAYFVAPDVDAQTELAFEVTATGRGTAGLGNPRQATADAAVTVLEAEQNATGTPTISGVPQVGNTLRADISGIEDDEGLPATLTYEWVQVTAGGSMEKPCRHGQQLHGVVRGRGQHDQGGREFHRRRGQPGGSACERCGGAGGGGGRHLSRGQRLARDDDDGVPVHRVRFNAHSTVSAFAPVISAPSSRPRSPTRTGYPVTLLTRTLTTTRDGNTTYTDSVSFGVSGVNLPGGDLPDGTVLNLGATALTVGTDSHSGTAGREQWDLQTLGISPTWVDGQELTVCANLAPVLESARADGTSLVLTYAEALDAGSEPAPGAYSVTRGRRRGPGGFGRVGLRQDGDADPGGGGHRREFRDADLHPGEQPGAGPIGPRCPGLLERDGRRQQRRHGHADDFRRGAGRRDADGGHLRHRGRRRPAVRIRLPVGADRSGGGKTDIGTNMSRYSPTYADVGSTIGVEVSFTDGKGYPEGPLASAESVPVTAPTTAGTCPADSDWDATLTLGYAFLRSRYAPLTRFRL